MENPANVNSPKTRKLAMLVADHFDHDSVAQMQSALKDAGVMSDIVSTYVGIITSTDGQEVEADKTFLTTASVVFDAVFVPGGAQSIGTLKRQGDAVHWINETFRHCKPIAAVNEGVELLHASDIAGVHLVDESSDEHIINDHGVITSRWSSSRESLMEKVKDTVGLGDLGVSAS